MLRCTDVNRKIKTTTELDVALLPPTNLCFTFANQLFYVAFTFGSFCILNIFLMLSYYLPIFISNHYLCAETVEPNGFHSISLTIDDIITTHQIMLNRFVNFHVDF